MNGSGVTQLERAGQVAIGGLIALVIACSPGSGPAGPTTSTAGSGSTSSTVAAGSSSGSAGMSGSASGPTGSTASALDAGVDARVDLASIVDAPMAWSTEREQLTLDYRRRHSDPAATDVTIDPHVIVLHYTAGGSAKATRGYFDNLRMEASRAQLAAGGAVNVSAHFVVDRDGTIYRLQPETRFARHTIGLNHVAIGIENVGDEKQWLLTDKQVDADVALIRDLTARHHITHLVGHYEVTGGSGATPYYTEREANYRNDKPDPGARFMALVRAKLADLDLKSK